LSKKCPYCSEDVSEDAVQCGSCKAILKPDKFQQTKKCPSCAEEIQEDAVKCRYCGEFLDGSKSAMLEKQGKGVQISTKHGAIIIILCAVFIIVSQFLSSNSYNKKAKSPRNTTPHYVTICSMAHVYVKENLKSPSTAEFPSCNEKAIQRLGNNKFRYSGYVDAQNGFGAMIRNKFMVEMQYKGDDNWSLLSIDL